MKNKYKWIVLIGLFLLNLVFLGLLIWGIVELSIHSGYESDLLGGLLVALDLFFMLFSWISITSYLTNNQEYKKTLLNNLNNFITKLNKKKGKEDETKHN